ncbi:unnamed protein product [Urochloa humidicola]
MEMAASWFLHHGRWPAVAMILPLIFRVLHAGLLCYGRAGAHGHQLLASGRDAKLLKSEPYGMHARITNWSAASERRIPRSTYSIPPTVQGCFILRYASHQFASGANGKRVRCYSTSEWNIPCMFECMCLGEMQAAPDR